MSDYVSRVPGPFRVTLQRVRVVDGQVVVDVLDNRGQNIAGVPLMVGGGGGNRFVFSPVKAPDVPTSDPISVPEDANTAELFLGYDHRLAPVVYGATQVLGLMGLVPQAPEVEEDVAHPGAFGPYDFVVSNAPDGEAVDATADVKEGPRGYVRMIMGADKSFNVFADRPIRFHVPLGGKFMVFSGVRSGMPVVMLHPTQGVINAIIDQVNRNTEQIKILMGDKITETYAAAAAAQAAFQYPEEARLLAEAARMQALVDASATIPSVGDEIGSRTVFIPPDERNPNEE